MLWHVWESARQVCKELSRKYGDYKGSFGSGNLKVLSLKPSKDYVNSSPKLDTPNVKITFSMLLRNIDSLTWMENFQISQHTKNRLFITYSILSKAMKIDKM